MKKISLINNVDAKLEEKYVPDSKKEHIISKKVTAKKEAACIEEIKRKREPNAKHYRMSDGSVRAVYYGSPIHYYDADSKKYEEIDNTLEYSDKSAGEEDFAGYQNRHGDIKVKFARQVGENRLMQINKGNHRIMWRLLGQKQPHGSARAITDYGRIENVCATVNNGSEDSEENKAFKKEKGLIGDTVKMQGEIRYNEFVKGADLQYLAMTSGLKENIVIKERLENYEFAFELQLKELEMRLSKDENEVEFYITKINEEGTEEEEILYTMPPAYMVDANKVHSEEVYYELEQMGHGKYILRIQADENWINSEDRVFPIKIDPTIVYKNNDVLQCRNFMDAGATDPSDNALVIGWTIESPTRRQSRGLVKWNLSSLSEVKIVNATLNFYQYDSVSPDYNNVSDSDFEVRKITSTWDADAQMLRDDLPTYGEVIDRFKYDESLDNGDREIVPTESPITIDITKVIESLNGVMIKSAMDTEPRNCHYVRLLNENYLMDGAPDATILTAFCPFITVTYLENRQIQSDQQLTNSINRAGTASLDLYTQNLRLVHEDLALSGEKLSLGISHIYNSRTSNSLSIAPYRGIYSSGNISMGRGWKTNLHQYMFPYDTWNEEYVSQEETGVVPSYVYIDQNGDEHIFIKTRVNQVDYEYIDENGSGLKYDPTENVIKDKSGNKLYFDSVKHRLVKVEDYYGNALNISYNAYGLI